MTPDHASLRSLEIPGIARFEAGTGGLTRLAVTSALAEAHIYLHGAHVTHFQPHGQAPVLFLSGRSFFETGQPIRGGVPICFPWSTGEPVQALKASRWRCRWQAGR